jgi:putative addiction module CopG family antidote
MVIELPTDLTQFVQDEVVAGGYQTESEVVSAALRLMRDRRRRAEYVRREIQPSLERLDRGEGISLDEDALPAFFEEIISRGNEKLGIKGDEA